MSCNSDFTSHASVYRWHAQHVAGSDYHCVQKYCTVPPLLDSGNAPRAHAEAAGHCQPFGGAMPPASSGRVHSPWLTSWLAAEWTALACCASTSKLRLPSREGGATWGGRKSTRPDSVLMMGKVCGWPRQYKRVWRQRWRVQQVSAPPACVWLDVQHLLLL